MGYVGNEPTAVPLTADDLSTDIVNETHLKDAFVGDFTEVTVAAGDSILLGDADGSGNTKRDTVQGILDLVSNVAVQSAQVSTSYDMTTASGNQDITGFGFDPAVIWMVYGKSGDIDWGVGMMDLSDEGANMRTTGTTGQVDFQNNLPTIFDSAGNSQVGAMTSITDGIRIAWTKNGSPTGTVQMKILGVL